ncbi:MULTISPECIES: relaxase/mobilization nuclease domain-containing protein [unclassified Streptomyces]|uniref:relaxase/mobilization nuclease domain-containing protein n=1 Tax=unclassified Streptomyces TaxID=2593676 RepID=UPI0011C8EB4E|nr:MULTISPECIES: relaxase/mobilization nuclease domain-containing protein [unclassified Streptomyces]TXS17250.1 mobilization protein [Streptomyces sp. wa22]WSQ79018.1 relaxase/mobilization nuclease domain-containing protein [Streptomyces sp. NBC_01213]WSQ86387.1 relaxase/mobilization nuclease domain-containing protein [Streptomyces sp. NBC_01212]
MIPRIHKQGSSTCGLLNYLYGKGTREEHVDPHLVASFDSMAPDPGRDPSATKEDLQLLLDQPLHLLDEGQRPDQHVWHCSVRAAGTDRILSDDEWGDIARRIVAATGIDPGGVDDAGCRWAAVRHADDHIHIIATLVREDGRRPNHHRSGQRAQAAARLIEADYDLHRVAPGDGTAAKRPTSAERHKAERQGQERTAREKLRETVRTASAGAASTDEFFDRLAADGLLIRKRIAPSGDLLGYKVALPDDRNKDDEPVFYAGSTLAPDLSLPRIRERWALHAEAVTKGEREPVRSALPPVTHPAFARRRAAAASWQALLIIDHGDDGVAAAQIAAAGEVLDALAKTSAAHTRAELRQAAFAFERASRSHVRAVRGHDHALRQAAHDLVHSGPALGRGEDGATTAMVIDMAVFLAIAAANWHAKRHHSQQAAAAQQAAEHLRAAYQAAAAHPIAALRQRGQQLTPRIRQRQADLLHQALPELAERIQAEPGWPALAATLADARQAGHDPAALLTEATRRRELDTADSISDVLVWRLRRTAHLPAAPESPPATSARDSRRASPSNPATPPATRAANHSSRRP